MPNFISYEQALDGEIFLIIILLGRQFIIVILGSGKKTEYSNISIPPLRRSDLNKLERKRQGKKETPSLLYIDSQSVKVAVFINEDKGIDGNKLVNDRKRHIIVDTLGLVWGVIIHIADIHNGTKAHLLVEHC